MIDDLSNPERPLSRFELRQRVDEVLEVPLDSEEAEEHRRENWGLGPEAILAAQQKDTMWAGSTYGEQ